MANNVIGFIGIEAHDLILYLSRILKGLANKVLLVDYAEHQSLARSIPIINQGDPLGYIIEYHGIYFTQKEHIEEIYGDYDIVLIQFGMVRFDMEQLAFIGNGQMLSNCTEIIYVVDQQRHHMEPLLQMATHLSNADKKELILRNMIHSNIDEYYIRSKFKEKIALEDYEIHVFYYDERDIKSGLLAQYNDQFTFPNISKDLKNYLQNKIHQLCPMETSKLRKRAYRAAERGN